MSRHGSVLAIPDNGPISEAIDQQIRTWPEFAAAVHPWPRSKWLSQLEVFLRLNLPGHSSRDYNLTARSLAPFPLAEKDWL